MSYLKKNELALQSSAYASEEDQEKSRNLVFGLGIVLLLAVCLAYESIQAWAARLEEDHHRGQLLAAYRRRHAWKKSDIPRLQLLGGTALPNVA